LEPVKEGFGFILDLLAPLSRRNPWSYSLETGGWNPLPVELILRKLSEKATEADLLQAYPQLVAEDIQAAIRYAADTIAHEETVIISRKAS